jgi:hypothetical protein
MKPVLDKQLNISAWCDRCCSITTFERDQSGSLFGVHSEVVPGGTRWYRLFRCSGCHRGGLGELFSGANAHEGLAKLQHFYPTSFARAQLPSATPNGIKNEIDEASLCADAGAFRAATALLRSALEKTLSVNGYHQKNLKLKIDTAAEDGVITNARRVRAQSNVRVLGNDVVHEPWREVDEDEYADASMYVHRIVEDFYEHREEVVATLRAHKRNVEEDGESDNP